jgi:hypothetical protein
VAFSCLVFAGIRRVKRFMHQVYILIHCTAVDEPPSPKKPTGDVQITANS